MDKAASKNKIIFWNFCYCCKNPNLDCNLNHGGQPDHPTVLYRYHPSRSGQQALEFLDDYRGYIQSDDYVGYDYLSGKKGILHLGCWAHARRKFMDVVKVRKKHRGIRGNPRTLADQALEYIGKLYGIERQICR